MTATTLLQRNSISVSDFRCDAGPDDRPFAEQHRCHSISYVRKGSFGCHSRGRFTELVAGSVLVGHPATNMSAATIMSAVTNACRSSFSLISLKRSATAPTSGRSDLPRRCPN